MRFLPFEQGNSNPYGTAKARRMRQVKKNMGGASMPHPTNGKLGEG